MAERAGPESDPTNAVAAAVDPLDATRAVVVSQTVFTAGHVLTTGGFLYYFANALTNSALLFAVLLITPEISSLVGLAARPVIRRLGGRKRTWLTFFLLARIVALGIPLTAISAWRTEPLTAFWVIIGSLAVSQALQSIAFTAYLSWMADLVPEPVWGRFFALRQTANVAVMAFLPAVTVVLRRDWSTWPDNDLVRLAYVAVFLSGGGLMLLAAVPMLRLPDLPVRWEPRKPRWRDAWLAVWRSRPLSRVIATSLWLALAQGLTQSAFFKYQVGVLRLPLEEYLLLSGLMYALQIPFSLLGGRLSDRYGDRWPLMISLLMNSGAMLFWLLARPGDRGWLIGAYAVWGLFGVVNVCLRNLTLRVAARSDNAVPIALFQHAAALCAGIAGLIGGWLLDDLLSRNFTNPLLPFQILFAVSGIGRGTAPLWLVGSTLSERDRQTGSTGS